MTARPVLFCGDVPTGMMQVFCITTMLLSLCMGWQPAFGQAAADTLEIEGIEVVHQRHALDLPALFALDDSLYPTGLFQDDLATLLGRMTTVTVRSYSPGSAASLSFRGTSSYHSLIRWKGVRLNSSFLGMTDLSQLPGALAREARILRSGGPDGIAGALIDLDAGLPGEKYTPLEADLALGSFGKLHAGAGAEWRGASAGYHARVEYQRAVNDFPYTIQGNDGQDTTMRRSSAGFSRASLIQGAWLRTGRHSVLTIDSWVRRSFRELPRNILAYASGLNESLRESGGVHVASFSARNEQASLGLSLAFRHQEYTYEYLAASTRTDTDARGVSLRLRMTRYLGDHLSVSTDMEANTDKVTSDNYLSGERQDEVRSKHSLLLRSGRHLHFKPFLRFAATSQRRPAWLPGFYAEWSKGPHSVSLGGERTVRDPSFNDLYWFPGGNPQLDREEGFSLESAYAWRLRRPKNLLECSASLFHHYIKGWISWQPMAGSSFWSPVNLREVSATGADLRVRWETHLQEHHFHATGGLSLVRSGQSQGIQLLPAQQVVYQPITTSYLAIGYKRGLFQALWTQRYTGERNTTWDGSSTLSPYHTADLVLSSGLPGKFGPLSISCQVLNITNQGYETIAWYPMPGRHFQIGIHLKTQKDDSKE